MKNRKLTLVAVVLGVCVATMIYAVLVQGGKRKQSLQKPDIATLPKVTSCSGALVVQSTFFRAPKVGSPATELVLQLMNNSDKSIVALSISWTSKKAQSAHKLMMNSRGPDTSRVLAAPHSLYEVALPLENIAPDANVQVRNVVFVDGTEEGCTDSVIKALQN